MFIETQRQICMRHETPSELVLLLFPLTLCTLFTLYQISLISGISSPSVNVLNHMSHIRSNTKECPLNCEGTQRPVSDPGSDGFYEIKVAERESLQQTMTIAYKIEDPTTPPQQTHPHLWFLFNVIPDSSDAFLHLGNCPDNGCNLYPKDRGHFSLSPVTCDDFHLEFLASVNPSVITLMGNYEWNGWLYNSNIWYLFHTELAFLKNWLFFK